jgi:hypothetical protein
VAISSAVSDESDAFGALVVEDDGDDELLELHAATSEAAPTAPIPPIS